MSPRIAQSLNTDGAHVAVHPRDFGGLGAPDHAVLARCVEQNLVLVTQNARDFRALVGTEEIHPGLVILPAVGRVRSEVLLRAVVAFLCERGNPMDLMVNHVLEVSADASMRLWTLPVADK